MFDNSGSNRDDIFRAESILSSDYDPERLLGRTEEVHQIADVFQPLVNRQSPEHLLLHGPAGGGKTSAVKQVFDELADETAVKTIYINCWQYNTRPSLLTEFLIKLGYPTPRKGKPVDELCAKLNEWLDKNRNIALALDEFDQLSDKTEVLYDIAQLNQQSKYDIGTAMISNLPAAALTLDPRVQSRISYKVLEFDPYTKSELVDILSQRTQKAFAPGAVTEQAIECVADWAIEEEGDCRQALEKLLQIGRQAVREGQSKITAEYVRQVISDTPSGE